MTSSFPMTRRAIRAGAIGTALSAPMIGKGSVAFAAAPGRAYSRRAVDLTEELIRRNYSTDNIRAVLGGNFRRLLAQVWG